MRTRVLRRAACALFVTGGVFVGSSASAAIGKTPGVASVTTNGAASYSIPLWAPTGSGGLTPNVALVYSSGAGNGYFGYGWGLAGLSAITRCPKTWVQDGARGAQRRQRRVLP